MNTCYKNGRMSSSLINAYVIFIQRQSLPYTERQKIDELNILSESV